MLESLRHNIAVTGSTGFVGQNISKYLNEIGYTIQSISLRNPNWMIDQHSDAVIHLAGKAHDTQNTSEGQEYFEVNTELTKKVFDQFLASNIRDFFYFSSVKATADTVEGILTEENISNPITPYGKSKLEAEKYLLSKELPKGKRMFIIRPCMIHGSGNKGNLNLLYQIVKRGIPWPLSAFDNKRSFLSIDNLNFLIEKMIENPDIPSGIYNFADDGTLSTNEVIGIMNEVLGKKPKFWKIPQNWMKSFAKIGDVVPFPLNSERLKKLTESYVVSNQKIKNTLKISSLPTDIKNGLKNTIQSFEK